MNCGLDETLMSQRTCRSKKAEHLKCHPWNFNGALLINNMIFIVLYTTHLCRLLIGAFVRQMSWLRNHAVWNRKHERSKSRRSKKSSGTHSGFLALIHGAVRHGMVIVACHILVVVVCERLKKRNTDIQSVSLGPRLKFDMGIPDGMQVSCVCLLPDPYRRYIHADQYWKCSQSFHSYHHVHTYRYLGTIFMHAYNIAVRYPVARNLV